MKALNISFDGPLPMVEASGDVEIEVEPENWDVVRVFNGMVTQWRHQTLGSAFASTIIRTGLDYAALPVVAAGYGVPADQDFLASLRVLEGETVKISNRRASRQLRNAQRTR